MTVTHKLPPKAEPGSQNGKNGKAPPGEPRKKLLVRRASEVTVRPVEWAVEPLIPLAKETIGAGPPDTAKSMTDVSFAAHLSTGKPLPFQKEGRLGDVIMLNYEDEAEDTLVPRLIANGADLGRIHIIDGTKGPNGEKEFQLRDVPLLVEYAKELPELLMVVVDPLGSFMDAAADTGSDPAMRATTAPLRQIAKQFRIVAKGNAHVNKDSLAEALFRVSGSLGGITGPARSVLMNQRQEDGTFLLAQCKNNLSARQGNLVAAVGFSLEERKMLIDGKLHSLPLLTWDEELRWIDPKVILRATPGEKTTVAALCADELKEILKRGEPRFGQDVYEELMPLGFSKETIKNARYLLGVEITGQGRATKWALPVTD